MAGTGRLPVALLAAAALGAALAVAALAEHPRIELTAAGQAAAHAAVLKRADLGSAAGWKGHTAKPDLTTPLPCAYQPKQSDLVVNGAAEEIWQNANAGLQFDSEAQVLQTPAMVRLDWQRTVLAPQVTPCFKAAVAKQLLPSERLVSFRRISFPKVGTYTRAYRAVIDVKTAQGTAKAMVDVVVVGRGRTEITLSTAAPLAGARVVKPAEERLAVLLAARAS